jgi:aminoglycoside/choline kinase family phosphotransferase
MELADMDLAVRDFLAAHLNGAECRLEKLAGDASTRMYFRVLCGPAPLILMRMGEPDPDPAFVSVQQVLVRAGVPVPAIHAFDPSAGLMLLEDFGDRTLEQAAHGADEQTWIALYSEALRVMADIQFRPLEQRATSSCPCFSLAFDVEKLMFEMDFFIAHSLEIWKRAEFAPGEKQALRAELEALCRELAAEPRVLCHRDYHSRNLMALPGGALGVIDFQDARMGPAQYDLVSLLHDSYVDMPAPVRETLYGMYLERHARETRGAADPARFREVYLLMILQRNLKAAGSFAYLDCVKNMGRYLARMPQCLGHVRDAFEQLAGMDTLRGLLAKHLPEIG